MGAGRMSRKIKDEIPKTDESDIDIHIIPDAVKNGNYQKRPFAW